jgi:hypothetical protein
MEIQNKLTDLRLNNIFDLLNYAEGYLVKINTKQPFMAIITAHHNEQAMLQTI